jgi:hypothetical protein
MMDGDEKWVGDISGECDWGEDDDAVVEDAECAGASERLL